jgi:hypothetical protein
MASIIYMTDQSWSIISSKMVHAAHWGCSVYCHLCWQSLHQQEVASDRLTACCICSMLLPWPADLS